jgi:predicted nucleic acid-binding protein
VGLVFDLYIYQVHQIYGCPIETIGELLIIGRDILNLLQTLQGFSLAPVLPFDAEPITVFGNLRAQGIRLSTMDLRIASIALSRGLVLLTRNTRDFAKVPGLMIEDWTT